MMRGSIVASLVVLVAAVFVPASSATRQALSPASLPPGIHATYERGGAVSINACPAPAKPGQAACFADVRIDAQARSEKPAEAGGTAVPHALGDNGAYSPAFLQSAYNAPSSTGGVGQTVAIVAAFDDPNAESDLAVYRSTYGLPACTTGNGCFRKVNAFGNASPLPTPDPNNGEWESETSLDLDMVSALCPNCHILLVEANSADTVSGGASTSGDLTNAVSAAVALGANVVSMSWGSELGQANDTFDVIFKHPGVRFFAASGDGGYGTPNYPATSSYVTAVGGTSLDQATSTGTRNATETAWSGSGSGCDLIIPEPSWEPNVCAGMRSGVDVSADADAATPVWFYDSYPLEGSTLGWGEGAGTSASSPMVAAIAALASVPSGSIDTAAPSIPYSHPGAFNDITSGAAAACGASICQAAPGYDLPTGLGTPNGVTGFAPAVPGPVGHLTAAAESAKVTLSWAAPGLVGGSTVKGYRVFRSDHGTVPIASLDASARTFRQTGLVNGKTYTYSVVALNALGQGTSSVVTSTPAPVAKLVLSPKTATIRAGGSQQYTVTGFNASGKSLGDETAVAKVSVTLGGSCPKGLCSATKAGAHTVSAALDHVTTARKLVVRSGPLDSFVLSPRTASMTAGQSRSFTAQGVDTFGNRLGSLTADVVFQISPNGSCTNNVCTATKTGKHKISAILKSTAIASGYEGNCALTVLGSVMCWGTNELGILAGTAALNGLTPPTTVPGLEKGVTAVSVGSASGCALQSGAAKCWGAFPFDVGAASATSSLNPSQVAGLTSGVKSISASWDTCAVTGAGGIDCWGDAPTGGTSVTWQPAPVAGLGGTAASVETSFWGQTCALMTSSGVECWFLGSGSPTGVTGLQSGVRQVAVGDYHACALTMDGQVKCWGDNTYGQLGDGTTNTSGVPVAVTGIPGTVQSISAGVNDTCAVTTAGAVYCWGEDGNGVQTDTDTPMIVPGLGSGMKSVAIEGGTQCALTSSGVVECWGADQFGQLGGAPGAGLAVTVPMGSYNETPALLTVS